MDGLLPAEEAVDFGFDGGRLHRLLAIGIGIGIGGGGGGASRFAWLLLDLLRHGRLLRMLRHEPLLDFAPPPFLSSTVRDESSASRRFLLWQHKSENGEEKRSEPSDDDSCKTQPSAARGALAFPKESSRVDSIFDPVLDGFGSINI